MRLPAAWSHHLNRWLRRGPPQHYQGPETSDIERCIGALASGDESRWRRKAPLPRVFALPVPPSATPAMVALGEEVRSGRFRVASRFSPTLVGFPPEWQASPFADDNWISSLHGLEWLVPLVLAHEVDPAAGHLRAAATTIADWIARNPFRGKRSRWAWHDHAAAKRLRLFAWFWERYRIGEDYSSDFSRLLLASVYQHALYHLDARNYRVNSNHGLEGIGALLAAAVTFDMFAEAPNWERVAIERLHQWIADNISPEGFHLEQSPAYHWFVLLRLVAIDGFLAANGRQVPLLKQAAEKAAAAWPHLLKPDGSIPTVGDSGPHAPRGWRKILEQHSGRPAPPALAPSVPPANPSVGTFIATPKAGYALFRVGPGDANDLHLLFRCAAFQSPHCHTDALSFTLYAAGRDWFVDPGYLSYHEWDPRRQYLRSARAHSLVLAGAHDFRTADNGVVDWGRDELGDWITSFHTLPHATHTRRVLVAGPREVRVSDRIQWARRGSTWQQLFQMAPDLAADIVSATEVRISDADGRTCTMQQSGPGAWSIVKGQAKPYLQGWHSPRYGAWEARPTLIFEAPADLTEVESRLLISE